MFNKSIPVLLLGLALSAGCETLGLGGDESSSDETISRDDRVSRDDRIGRERTNRDRAGFEMKYPNDFDHGVPDRARLVRELEEDSYVTYKTPHDGRLYVYDVDDRKVIYQGEMRDGEAFTVDLRDDRASLAGRAVNARLNRDHRYRLYFVEDQRSSRLDDRDRDFNNR
jgi:hypothetical protein